MANVEILPFTPDRAGDFDRINRAWIEEMFVVEPVDDQVLRDPQRHILDQGGDVLFAALPSGDVVGTGALKRLNDGAIELTKMGVTAAARGHKVGHVLLDALIARGVELADHRLFILTNSACAAAIHLYEKAGFHHSEDILRTYGGTYERCDVGLDFPLPGGAAA